MPDPANSLQSACKPFRKRCMETTTLKQIDRAPTLVGRFCTDRSGSFATIFGIALTAAAFMAGVAIDYSRMARTKSAVASVLDAAVLSVGADMLDGLRDKTEIERRFRELFDANMQLKPDLAAFSEILAFDADPEAGRVSASVESNVEMAFLAIAGFDSVPVRTESQASFTAAETEVTMMLDVTGSMGNAGKLKAMKKAASDAIDILIPESGSGNTRVGLVPFSAGVNAGRFGEKASVSGRACVTERRDQAFTDASYVSFRVGNDSRATCPPNPLSPLSSDATSLKSQVSGYMASGATAGHLGIQWSYYMLSPKWQNLWPEDSRPSEYESSATKIAILMTDGEFNTYFDGRPANQAAASNSAAILTCTEMKRPKGAGKPIKIYAVAFDAPQAARDTLRACASEDSGSEIHYFEARNPAELNKAFTRIAMSIRKLTLTR